MRYSRGTLDDRYPDPSCCPHRRWSVPCLDARPDRRCQDASWSQQRQVHVPARSLSKSADRHVWGTMTRQRFATERWWAFAISAEQSLSRGELTDSFRGRALFSKFIETNAALGQHLVTERDDSRQKTRNVSSIGIAASIAVTIAALIAVFVLGRRAVLAISRPLTELRNTLTRQRDGEVDVRANVNQDFTEMRSLAIS